MQLIGKHQLSSIQGLQKEMDIWIAAWVTEVSHATWRDFDSILRAFPRARAVDQTAILFPVCGNEFPKIKVKFKLSMGAAMISEVIQK